MRKHGTTMRAAQQKPVRVNAGKGLVDVAQVVHGAVFKGEKEEAAILSLSYADAQAVLDYVWMSMDLEPNPKVLKGYQTSPARDALRQLSLKLALKYDMFPAAMIIKGVTCKDSNRRGEGGYADVYFGITDIYQRVAIKRLRLYETANQEKRLQTRQAFYRESMLWKHLSHQHVLRFKGISDDVFPTTICMILPWMDNGSIRDYIPKLRREGRLPDHTFGNEVKKWLHQTAQGLAYLHEQGIIHGDLHPGNILIDQRGSACLTDFGIAAIAEAHASTPQSCGALRWQAPELIDPEEFSMDPVIVRPTLASDVYAFGLTAIEIYTGHIPFHHIVYDVTVQLRVVKGVRPRRPTLPDGHKISNAMWELISLSWAQQASDRPSSSELANKLADVPSSEPDNPPPQASATTPEELAQDLGNMTVESLLDAKFNELMNEVLRTPDDRYYFFMKAGKVGMELSNLGPAYYNKAAQVLHKALLAYSDPKALLMIYEGMLKPDVLKLVKEMYDARPQ